VVETGTDAVGQRSEVRFGIPAFSVSQRAAVTSTTYTADASDLQFWTNPTSGTASVPRMTILPSGYVGIGTTNPGTALYVVGSFTQTSLPVLLVYKNADASTANGSKVTFAGTVYNTQWTLTSTSRFTLTGPSGYYLILTRLQGHSIENLQYVSPAILVNGITISDVYTGVSTAMYVSVKNEYVYKLNTNDYVEVQLNAAGTMNIEQNRSHIQVVYLSGTT
jgi:hypothetical protein